MLGTLLITAGCAGGTSFGARDRQYAPLAATQAITPAEAIRRAAEAAPGSRGPIHLHRQGNRKSRGQSAISQFRGRLSRPAQYPSFIGARGSRQQLWRALQRVGPAFGTYNALPPEGLIAVRFGLGDRHDPGAAYLLGQLGSPLRGGAKSPPRLKSRRLDRPADVTTAQPIRLLRTREHEAGGDHR